jgi:hypothetical protein
MMSSNATTAVAEWVKIVCDDVFYNGLVDVEVFMNKEIAHCSYLAPGDLRPFGSDAFWQRADRFS